MSNVLLRELSNSDIDWMVANGKRIELAAETRLIQPGETPDAICVLLTGEMSLIAPNSSGCENQEVVRLPQGEIIGETPLFNGRLTAGVQTLQPSLVLAIPHAVLVEKLHQDVTFSAHFYRAIALILAERLRQLLEMPGHIRDMGNQPVKDALLIFGELRDSDVDWLTSAGHVEKVPEEFLLIQAGKPVDALHIILDGQFTTLVTEGEVNPLTLCFECAEKTASTMRSIGTLTKGELAGTISFLDFNLQPTTLRAAKESLVLSIPRQTMSAQLQNNSGFASRFYRVLAMQLSNRLQSIMGQLGCGEQPHSGPQEMDDDMEYDDELDLDSLHSVSQGAARFNWMMKRLGVGSSLV